MTMQERIDGEIAMQSNNHRAKRAAKNLMGNAFSGNFPLRLRCECGQVHCDDIIEVPVEMSWSAKPMLPLFVIAPDHEQLDIETIVEKTETYFIVKKDLPV